MSFFANDAINRVNLQSGVQSLAYGAGQIFLLVFLIRAGVSVPAALLAQAGIVAARFAVRPALLPLAVRFGLKPLLVAGTLAMAVQYPLLATVRGVGPGLIAVCVASALGEVIYYVAYNAYFAAMGDAHLRGRQIAVGMALSAVASVVAPLAGAWALVTVGPLRTFTAVAAVQALSVLPLLGLPNVGVKASAPGAWQAARPAVLLILADGWFDACFIYVWQIGLFMALGQRYFAYGGAMALAGVVGAGFGLIIGRHVDAGHGRRSAMLAFLLAGALVIARSASFGIPAMAVAANALGGLVMPLIVPPLATATHNIAKASPCPLRVKMATEGAWDVGCFFACLMAAALAGAGASLALGVLLALPAVAASMWLLWRYYSPGRTEFQAG